MAGKIIHKIVSIVSPEKEVSPDKMKKEVLPEKKEINGDTLRDLVEEYKNKVDDKTITKCLEICEREARRGKKYCYVHTTDRKLTSGELKVLCDRKLNVNTRDTEKPNHYKYKIDWFE